MLETPILQILKMFPRGTTDGQLLWRLGSGGHRNDPSAVLAALTALSERGEVCRDGDRWLPLVQSTVGGRPIQPPVGGHEAREEPGKNLSAVHACIEPPLPTSGPPADDGNATTHPVWSSILSYFASTQRQDPRGSVERFPDQHGVNWQLFDVQGRWWQDCRVVIPSAQLSGKLREALARNGHQGMAAIGWPITVLRSATGVTCAPGLLLPARWVLGEHNLTLTIDPVPPTINPAWMRIVRRRVRGSEEELEDAIFGSEEGTDVGTVAPRLAHALASFGGALLRPAHLAHEMSLASEGLRNTAAIFLPDEAAFTRRVAEDLDRIAGWDAKRQFGTSLSALIESGILEPTEAYEPPPLIAPKELSDRQREAAEAALIGPITAIQGPPGTGKSQTIVALLCSAVAAGQSVLFVARNHRALDEVEGRLAAILPGLPILTRGRDADGERDTSFLDSIKELSVGSSRDADQELSARASREQVAAAGASAASARKTLREQDRLQLALCDLVERANDIRASLPTGVQPRRPSWFARLRLFPGRWRNRNAMEGSDLPGSATLLEIELRIVELRRRLRSLPDVDLEPHPISTVALRRISEATVLPDPGTVRHLQARMSELGFQRGGAKVSNLTPEDAALVLCHRPIWAVSSLSVPARIPLVPALFDIAIFDEASQADIASALPVLARARRAIIVGDPQQLSFIPGLGREQEHALMDAASMPKAGRASWAQSINSLFDFAAHRLGPDRVWLLSDQFRSAPAIVDYTSRAFYGGRLVPRREDEDFTPPKSYRPGLHWEDVRGPAGRVDGGNINEAEAEWIAARVTVLSGEEGFDGEVGVISPFNAQMALIRRKVEARLSQAVQDRLKLRVDTVDRWQGGEADIVFFSLVAGPGGSQTATTFLSRERRRFNVAVSRARAVAVIVGDLAWARQSKVAHIADLADRATRPFLRPQRGYDSLWERRMHEALKRRGLEATPQYPIGSRSLDFALFAGDVMLDLEVDGERWHTGAGGGRKTADRMRDRELIGKGWKVRRFWVWELQQDMEACLDTIERDLGRR